jgi:hypothetical protein
MRGLRLHSHLLNSVLCALAHGDRGSGIFRIKSIRCRERLMLLKRFELLRASGESLGRRTLWRRRTLC